MKVLTKSQFLERVYPFLKDWTEGLSTHSKEHFESWNSLCQAWFVATQPERCPWPYALKIRKYPCFHRTLIFMLRPDASPDYLEGLYLPPETKILLEALEDREVKTIPESVLIRFQRANKRRKEQRHDDPDIKAEHEYAYEFYKKAGRW